MIASQQKVKQQVLTFYHTPSMLFPSRPTGDIIKIRGFAVSALALTSAALLTTPAFAAEPASIHVATMEGSITLDGGSQVRCEINEPNSVVAEFDVDGTIVAVNIMDGVGPVAIVGDTEFEGMAMEVNASTEESAFSITGSNESGVGFIIHGVCNSGKR